MRSSIFQFLILCVLFSAVSLYGQQDRSNWARAIMWINGDPDFEVTEIPEKWANESAVILCESIFLEYKKQAMAAKANNDLYARTRIKLLDKAAVNEYAEFTFEKLGKNPYSRDGIYFGIKIIKPDGSEQEIDVMNSVQMEKYSNSKERRTVDEGYRKLALPNLEIGDIIDYYYVIINTVSTRYGGTGKRYEFEPYYHVLPGDYPVVKGKLGFLPERKCYINLSATNGAPEPVKQVIREKEYYVVEYGDLDKVKTQLWTYPARQYPTVKFQIIIAPGYVSPTEKQFLGEAEVIKGNASKQEYLRLLNIISNKFQNSKSGLEEAGIDYVYRKRPTKSTEGLIEDLYYFYRNYLHYTYQLTMSGFIQKYYLYDRFEFVQAFSAILKKNKLEHRVFIGVPRNLGTIDSVTFLSEIRAGIEVELNDEIVYIFEPDRQSVLGEVPGEMDNCKILGTEMIVFQNDIKQFESKIPLSDPSAHFQIDSSFVTFDTLKENKIYINQKLTIGGGLKEQYQQTLITPDYYIPDEYNFIEGICKIKKSTRESHAKDIEYLDEEKGNYQEYRTSFMESYLGETYSLVDFTIDTIIIHNMGRSSDEPDVKYELIVQTEDLIKSSGDYLILEAGRLIGKNIQLNPREKDRKTDIYMPFPRQYNWVINIQVPDGYRPKNLEGFNYSIHNETGGFESEARLIGGLISIHVEKYYKHGYEPLEKWPLLLEYMEAANDFVQQQMVFEKVEL